MRALFLILSVVLFLPFFSYGEIVKSIDGKVEFVGDDGAQKTADWVKNFKRVAIGKSITYDAGWGPGVNTRNVQFVSSILTGDSVFTQGTAYCRILDLYGLCMVPVTFSPTSEGSFTGKLTSTLSYERYNDDTNQWESHVGSIVWDVIGTGILPPVPPADAKIVSPENSICVEGVRLNSQSIAIPISLPSGAGNVVYSSEFSAPLSFLKGSKYKAKTYVTDGLNLSSHYFYDITTKVLYTGGGFSYPKESFVWSGAYNVVLGDEVLVFDTDGTHLRTLSLLTGFVKREFTYDSNFKLSGVSLPHGKSIIINRDLAGRISSITEPFGKVTTFSLDLLGRVATISQLGGGNTVLEYYADTKYLKSVTKPEGQKRTILYDSEWKVIGETNSGGFGFDLVRTSPSTNVESVMMNTTLGRGTEHIFETDPVNETYSAESIAANGFRSLVIRDANLNENISNSLRSEESLFQNDPRFGVWNKVPLESSVTIDSKTKVTEYSVTTVPAVTLANPFLYSTLKETVRVNGVEVEKVFNKTNLTETTSYQTGLEVVKEIDAYERPISVRRASENKINYAYNSDGLLAQTSQGLNSTNFSYDSYGQLVLARNVRGEEVRYIYNSAGKVNKEIFPDGRFVEYSYDDNGNLTGITPPGRSLHALALNVMEMLETYQPPSVLGLGVKNTTYLYNHDKQITKITRPDLREIVFSYSPTKGLLTSQSMDSVSQTYDYITDSFQVSAITSFDSVESAFTYFGDVDTKSEQQSIPGISTPSKVSFGYNNFFRRTSRKVETDYIPSSTKLFEYNAIGQLTKSGNLDLSYNSVTARLSGTVLDNISDSYIYDSNGNLSSYAATFHPVSGPSEMLYSYTLVRDVAFRISEKFETVGGVTSHYCYFYDKAGRLTSIIKDGVPVSFYLYDGNGNRISSKYDGNTYSARYDEQDRLLAYGNHVYSYNANGELVSKEENVSTITTFGYDSLGRLKAVSLPSGQSYSYKLDWRGRRVAKLNLGAFKKRYTFEDSLRLATSYDEASAVATEFVFGNSPNSPEYMIRGGEKFRIIKDHLGSPRVVVNSVTGAVSQSMSYNEWGLVLSDTNPGFQPFGFAGGLYDSEAGLVQFGARDYDAQIGRWTSKDPIRFEGGDSNLYGYVLNDPINRFDPNGQRDEVACAAAAYLCEKALDQRVDIGKLQDGLWDPANEENFDIMKETMDAKAKKLIEIEKDQLEEQNSCNYGN